MESRPTVVARKLEGQWVGYRKGDESNRIELFGTKWLSLPFPPNVDAELLVALYADKGFNVEFE